MGTAGAAIATVIGQIVAAILATIFNLKVKIGNDEKVIYKEEKEYNLNEKTSSDEICEMLSKMLGIDKNKIQVKLAVEKE